MHPCLLHCVLSFFQESTHLDTDVGWAALHLIRPGKTLSWRLCKCPAVNMNVNSWTRLTSICSSFTVWHGAKGGTHTFLCSRLPVACASLIRTSTIWDSCLISCRTWKAAGWDRRAPRDERNPMSLVGRWNGSALKDGNVVGALRQERDHSLQMKQTCEDERDLCDLHTCDRLKATTQTRPVVILKVCVEEHMRNECWLYFSTTCNLVYAFLLANTYP